MPEINFFTPIHFGNQPKTWSQFLLEKADSYFYLGQKVAHVVPESLHRDVQDVIFAEHKISWATTALKIISYFTLILPALIFSMKAVLRPFHKFHILDVKQKLEERVNLSQSTIEKIQNLISHIHDKDMTKEFSWHVTTNHSLIFSLPSTPHLIFKMPRLFKHCSSLTNQQIIERRFANTVKAQEVCLINRFYLLAIPHTKKFEVEFKGEKISVIAEEKFEIQHHESAQEHLYQLSGLDETIRQLTAFIAKTGFSDVTWRNIPITNPAVEFEGPRCIALIDLEEMERARVGIFGQSYPYRRGLIRCVFSEKQIDIVLAEARRHGIQHPRANAIKEARMQEIQSDRQLLEFYTKKGILKDPLKPIEVPNLDSLGLNLDEQGIIRTSPKQRTGTDGLPDWIPAWEEESVPLRLAVIDVIDQINQALKEAPEGASIKGARSIYLNTNQDLLSDFRLRNRPKGNFSESAAEYMHKEHQSWLGRIIDALIEKGHIFKWISIDASGYQIQA